MSYHTIAPWTSSFKNHICSVNVEKRLAFAYLRLTKTFLRLGISPKQAEAIFMQS